MSVGILDVFVKAGDVEHQGMPSLGTSLGALLGRYIKHLGLESSASKVLSEIQEVRSEEELSQVVRIGQLQATVGELVKQHDVLRRMLESLIERSSEVPETYSGSAFRQRFDITDIDFHAYDVCYQIIFERSRAAQESGGYADNIIDSNELNEIVFEHSMPIIFESLQKLQEVGVLKMGIPFGDEFFVIMSEEPAFLFAQTVHPQLFQATLDCICHSILDDEHWFQGEFMGGNISNHDINKLILEESDLKPNLFLTDGALKLLESRGYLTTMEMIGTVVLISSVSVDLKRVARGEQPLSI